MAPVGVPGCKRIGSPGPNCMCAFKLIANEIEFRRRAETRCCTAECGLSSTVNPHGHPSSAEFARPGENGPVMYSPADAGQNANERMPGAGAATVAHVPRCRWS